jgi:hypothetical protein
MTKSNSSATLSTSNLYEHPWFNQLRLLDNTITCESPSQQKLKSAVTGQKSTKYCPGCNSDLPLNDFAANRCKADKLNPYCKKCCKRNKKEVDNLKRLHPKPEQCQCCGSTSHRLMLDHDHVTLEYRGWICIKCNTAIGMLGDNIEGVTQALHYLTNGHQI